MTKDRADRPPKLFGSPAVLPQAEKQATERRRLEDALEDDDVYEALASLRAEKQWKGNK